MIVRNPRLQRHVAEHPTLIPERSAHLLSPQRPLIMFWVANAEFLRTLLVALPADVHLVARAERAAQQPEELRIGALRLEQLQRLRVDVVVLVRARLFLELVLEELELGLGQRADRGVPAGVVES